MKNVLLTAVGGDISQGVARIIRLARPGWRLVGTDIHEQHAGRLFVDTFLAMPPARSPEYITKLDAIIWKERIDIVIPLSEPELLATVDVLPRWSEVKWISPGPTVVKCGTDKLATVRALESMGLPVPWTVDVSNGMPLEYPCIYKPRFGAGGHGVRRVRNAEEAVALRIYGDAIFQELLEPDDAEITCAVYRTGDGRSAVLQMKRRLMDSTTGWAKVVFDAEVQSQCLAIAEGLDLQGSMNIQLRVTNIGPRVFEINPRYSSTTWMRHLIGFQDMVWALDELDGLPISFPKINLDTEIARMHDAAILTR